MSRNFHVWQAVLAACLLLVGLVMPVGAREKPSAAAVDRKLLDRQIDEMLKVVIDSGADIHNGSPKQGIPHNPAGCYRLYHDFLAAMRPLLSHRPELQTAIES